LCGIPFRLLSAYLGGIEQNLEVKVVARVENKFVGSSEKANLKVLLAVPNLKDDYLKRQEVQEAFARFFCKAYVQEAPPLPECCIKKALEYKPTKSFEKKT